MATITFKGNAIKTSGNLPTVGSQMKDFKLTRTDLSDTALSSYSGKRKVLNIFPSIDTGVCATSVRRFNKEASTLPNAVVLNISADLPFAQKRFCGAEGIENSDTLSTFRSTFAKDYGLEMTEGPLAGLCSRAVLVLDEQNKVIHAEQVAEIASEPNYEAALKVLK